jgi:hypothetical protein
LNAPFFHGCLSFWREVIYLSDCPDSVSSSQPIQIHTLTSSWNLDCSNHLWPCLPVLGLFMPLPRSSRGSLSSIQLLPLPLPTHIPESFRLCTCSLWLPFLRTLDDWDWSCHKECLLLYLGLQDPGFGPSPLVSSSSGPSMRQCKNLPERPADFLVLKLWQSVSSPSQCVSLSIVS